MKRIENGVSGKRYTKNTGADIIVLKQWRMLIPLTNLRDYLYTQAEHSDIHGIEAIWKEVHAKRTQWSNQNLARFAEAYWELKLLHQIRNSLYASVWETISRGDDHTDYLDPFRLKNTTRLFIARLLYLAIEDEIEVKIQPGVHRVYFHMKATSGLSFLLRLFPFSELWKAADASGLYLKTGEHFIYRYEAPILSLAKHFEDR